MIHKTLFFLVLVSLVFAEDPAPAQVPNRIRATSNISDQKDTLYLCISNSVNSTNIKIEDSFVLSKYVDLYEAGTFTVNVANDSLCDEAHIIPSYGVNQTVLIGGSFIASIQSEGFVRFFDEGFTTPVASNMTQVFILVEDLKDNSTAANITFTSKKSGTSTVFELGANSAQTVTLLSGDYDVTMTILPTNQTKSDDFDLKGGDFFTLIVDFEYEFISSDESADSSSGGDWVIWVVVGTLSIVVVVVVSVLCIALFVHYRKREQYATV